MKKIINLFTFIPFIKRFYKRRYYATGLGTYLVNSFFKRVLGINRKGDFLVHFTSRVNSPNKLLINKGKNNYTVYVSLATSGGCYYQAINGIEFGEGTIWSYNCSFISSNHSYNDLSKHIKTKGIKIGKYVWFGSNCVVLPEVEVGDYSIIGAGSIVTKSIPEYSIAVGNPAKIIAKRCKKCLKKLDLNETCNCNIK